MDARRRVLLTGAAGRIGTAYLKHAGGKYSFRLADLLPIPETHGHEAMQLDLADPAAAARACQGIDTVVHLAANPHTTAEFYRDLLEPNFKATYNIFRAAKDAGCSRLIFASSVNAVFGYPAERQVRSADAPWPGNIYGVSKAFGEALGAYFSSKEGLSCICIRIGGVGDPARIHPDTADEHRCIFISYRDLCHLVDRCIERPDIPFAVVHGASNNRRNFLDITDTARLLDYRPQDDAFDP